MIPNIPPKIIGICPGEKLHEVMCSKEIAYFVYEFEDHLLMI